MFTISNDIVNEIIIKNSKFICIIHKIYTIEDVDNYLTNIKKMYKDANHYCYAYIIDDKKKFSDDNEPSGTAGSPIMQVLEKNNLNYVICVVIRYFGGIKLGAGGLVRAYSKSVSDCINKSTLNKLVEGYNVDIIFDYDHLNKINYFLKDITIKKKEYMDKIIYNLDIDTLTYNLLIKKNINININIRSKLFIEKDIQK